MSNVWISGRTVSVSTAAHQLTSKQARVVLFLPLHPFKSLRSRAKADSSGLSCMLLPFLPRRPHRVVNAPSSSPNPRLPAVSVRA